MYALWNLVGEMCFDKKLRNDIFKLKNEPPRRVHAQLQKWIYSPPSRAEIKKLMILMNLKKVKKKLKYIGKKAKACLRHKAPGREWSRYFTVVGALCYDRAFVKQIAENNAEVSLKPFNLPHERDSAKALKNLCLQTRVAKYMKSIDRRSWEQEYLQSLFFFRSEAASDIKASKCDHSCTYSSKYPYVISIE